MEVEVSYNEISKQGLKKTRDACLMLHQASHASFAGS